ncbi:antifreeze protein [Maritimibacter sp. DP1N21-5]|nr:antifreeze protein [Maritimibacter sp. DP1N21-5]
MDYWANVIEAGMIVGEANMVIAMRLWGMAGLWSVTPSENARMLSEKTGAYTRAIMNASVAAATGGDAAKAAMKPIRQKTKSNVKRLAKRGPRLP